MERNYNLARGYSAKKLLEIAKRYDYSIEIHSSLYRKNQGYIMADSPRLRSPYPRVMISKQLNLDYLHRISGL